MPALRKATNGGTWAQEPWPTGDPDIRGRVRSLRAMGYAVRTFSMGQQVTDCGPVRITMIDIRATEARPYIDDIG